MTMLQPMKNAARKTWAEGEYLALARFLPPSSAHLVRAAGVERGDKVLDVACGTGVTAITAARHGAEVTGLDLTPDLLSVAEEEAARADVTGITWSEGDAEDMPYDDTFDLVLSSFGHMFTPDPRAVRDEMLRVLKPGGRIAFTTWPPESVVGQIFKVLSSIVTPPPDAAPPPQWGDTDTVRDRLADAVTDLGFERGTVSWPTLSPGHLWGFFRETYGPFIMAMEKLQDDPEKQLTMAEGIQSVFDRFFEDNAVAFDYLVTRATKA